jgi:FkbM family methyltransferase
MINYPELNWRLQHLRRELQMILSNCTEVSVVTAPKSGLRAPITGKGKTLLVTPNEVNLHHGTGVLLNRLFAPTSAFVLRSHDDYPDKGPIASSVLRVQDSTRPELFSSVMGALDGLSIERILCVPYYAEDFRIATAAQSILGVPMVTWMMDDNHIHTSAVPKDVAVALCRASDICFAISAELRDAYQSLFEHKFYTLPPTVSSRFVQVAPLPDFSANLRGKTCAMVGNVWGASWFRRLIDSLKQTDWKVDWFGRGSACGWLETTSEELRAHGIQEQGFVAEDELAGRLAAYPFVIVPTGTGDESDDRKQITMLSLPTRLPYLLAAAQIPILVVGSAESCSARFVRRFGVGLSCPYEAGALRAALAKLGEAEFNAECRRNAASVAPQFSDAGLAEWIWKSCEKGSPVDNRFEAPFRRDKGSVIPFIDDPAPVDLYGDFKTVYSVMRRIAQTGYTPDFIFDVGASTGVWSDTVRRVFPRARSILVEPLPDRYPDWYHRKNPDFELVPAAASNQEGRVTFQVSNDLYGSSLLNPQDDRTYESVEVAVTTLDAILKKKKIVGRGILKIDVQFAEHLVLEGATELLSQVDFLVLELTLKRAIPEARTFLEMINDMESRGFHYLDDIGDWRSPITGQLEQKDIILCSKRIMKEMGL